MNRGLRLAALAAALYVIGVAVWVRYDRRSVREVFEPGSAFNSGPEGVSLAYAYLQERAPSRVSTLRHRVAASHVPKRGVVFRVQPGQGPFLPSEEAEDGKDDGKPQSGKKEKDGKKEKTGKTGKREATGGFVAPSPHPLAPSPGGRGGTPGPAGASAFGSLGGGAPSPGDWGAGRWERGSGGEDSKPERSPLLTPDEEEWIRGGGRLVIAISAPYGTARITSLEGRQPIRKVFPIWPGVTHLVPPTVRGLAAPDLSGGAGGHAVFLAGDSPMILRQVVGEGELVLLSTPEILNNANLGHAGHLALLETLAGLADRRDRRPVLFDERVHGLADSGGVVALLADWGLGPLLLLGLIATGASFWRASGRLGPPDREERDTRSDAVELLDSLADLYDRALDRADAVRLYHESFLRTLAIDTGLRGRALDERAAALLDGFAPPAAGDEVSRERFDQALRTINQAFRRVSDAKRK